MILSITIVGEERKTVHVSFSNLLKLLGSKSDSGSSQLSDIIKSFYIDNPGQKLNGIPGSIGEMRLVGISPSVFVKSDSSRTGKAMRWYAASLVCMTEYNTFHFENFISSFEASIHLTNKHCISALGYQSEHEVFYGRIASGELMRQISIEEAITILEDCKFESIGDASKFCVFDNLDLLDA